MEKGYQVHLANPSAIQQYEGLKHADDKHEAFWLAEMLRLGILPEGYIYPKQERPVRDLLRKRGHLIRPKTSANKGANHSRGGAPQKRPKLLQMGWLSTNSRHTSPSQLVFSLLISGSCLKSVLLVARICER